MLPLAATWAAAVDGESVREAHPLRPKIVEDVPPGHRCRMSRYGTGRSDRCGVRALDRGYLSKLLEGGTVLARCRGSLVLECSYNRATCGWLQDWLMGWARAAKGLAGGGGGTAARVPTPGLA